jgi:hypothetical protein
VAKKATGRVSRKSGKSRPKKSPTFSKPVNKKQVIGWREWVGLPLIGVERIKAKLDTGARSSALHAFNIRPLQRTGISFVQFDVHPLQRNDNVYKTCVAEAVDYRWITNSGGGREKRFVIVTMLRMGGETWPIEVTLADRDQMGFRMLIGRTAMEHRLIIDPTTSYRLGKPRKTDGTFNRRLVPKMTPIADEEE